MTKHAGKHKQDLGRIHARWVAHRHRRTDDPTYRDDWHSEQCGTCRFWFPLAGNRGYDWGACAGPESQFDGLVRFEHDGCESHERSDDGWSTPGTM